MKGLHNSSFPRPLARHWSIFVTHLPTRCAREPAEANKRFTWESARTSPCQNIQRDALCTSATDPRALEHCKNHRARTGVTWRSVYFKHFFFLLIFLPALNARKTDKDHRSKKCGKDV